MPYKFWNYARRGAGFLKIYSVPGGTAPYILLNDSLSIDYIGTGHVFYDGVPDYLIKISKTGSDTVLDTMSSNKNIYLKPNGTGNIKFGAYSAGAATDSTGYITILDAAGNTRKLMVQA